MLTIGIAGVCFAASLWGMGFSLAAIRHYRKWAWYPFWGSAALCTLSGIYAVTWILCYRM